jgi:hypothetical protein
MTEDLTLESESIDDAEPATVGVAAPEDIDPGQWLQKTTSGVITGYVTTKAGRLKIAAMDETETDAIRRAAESIDPSNPRGPRKLNIRKLRLGTVAASMNKAYGYTAADPRFLTPDKLVKALSGEVTMIVNEITKLGGFVEDDQGRNLDSLFQIS